MVIVPVTPAKSFVAASASRMRLPSVDPARRDGVGQETQGVVGGRGDRIRVRAVARPVGGDELADRGRRVVHRVVVGEARAFHRVAADLDELWRIPAVGAEQRRLEPERPGLPGDQACVRVVAGDAQDVRVERPDRRQLRREVAVPLGVFRLGEDAASERGERLAERRGQADAVVAAGVDQDRRGLRLQVPARERREHLALVGVDEADAEDVVPLLRHLDVGRGGGDHRDPVALRDRRRRDGARRGILADERHHVIARDEFGDDGRGLGGVAPVVLGEDLDRPAEHPACPVDLVRREQRPVLSGEGERGGRAGQGAEEADLDPLRLRNLFPAAGVRPIRRRRPAPAARLVASGDSIVARRSDHV